MNSETTNDLTSASEGRQPSDGCDRDGSIAASDASGGVSPPLAKGLLANAAISEADRPTNVLFFDGVCGLCNCSVDFILSRDRQETIRFAPLQGETALKWQISNSKSQISNLKSRLVSGTALAAGRLAPPPVASAIPLTSESQISNLKSEISNPPLPTFDTIVWLDQSGRGFVRSAAAVRVLWQLGGVWSVIGSLLWLIPRPLRDVGYRIVSANRYRLFGKRETCRLPTPNERRRFLA